MSLLANSAVIGGEIDTGDIGHSLRFRSAASAYLSRTFGAPTSNTSWALSLFDKRGILSTIQSIFSAGDSDLRYTVTTDTITLMKDGSVVATSTAVFRDVTSPVHLFIRSNGTNIKLYVNTVEVLSYTGTIPDFNSAVLHTIGRYAGSATEYFDGYRSRICFVDGGGSLTPQDFVTFNSQSNEWVTKTQSAVKAVVDAGGTNSFMLDFDNATSLTTLGYDNSAKGNNWTCNGFSLTAGATYDHMLDVPGNSYATLNPLIPTTNHAYSDGNLKATLFSASDPKFPKGSMFASSGKWSAEYKAIVASSIGACGITNATAITSGGGAPQANSVVYFSNGTIYKNGVSQGSFASFTTANTIRIEMDLGALTCAFYKDGILVTTITGVTADSYTFGGFSNSVSDSFALNFGQQPLQGGTPSAGFKALCQANLPIPAILNPEDHHQVVTVTKLGNTNFTIPWDATTYDTYFEIKSRGAAGSWYQIDGLRGYDKYLSSNDTAAEVTDTNVLGVSGTTGTLKSTLADGTYVVCMWKAGLASARQTNTAGSITSTVSRNVEAGFSIAIYTGTGANATVGHGLGKVPGLVIVKQRSAGTAEDWEVWHSGIANTERIQLNSTSAKVTSATSWNSTSPTSTVFSVGTHPNTNESTKDFVAYCFAEIEGFSKFDKCTGNASTDGPNPNLGFKAKTFETKCISTTGNWTRFDSVRDGYNVASAQLYHNANTLETSVVTADIDSNSVKLRLASDPNSAQTFIYSAFADVAGKFSLGR